MEEVHSEAEILQALSQEAGQLSIILRGCN
jgi:hypothetical protein